MTEAQLKAFREGAPLCELLNDGRPYFQLLKNVETYTEDSMIDLMELDYKDLNIAGLQMLVAGKISTTCVNCGKPAEDVLVSRLVGDDFQIRLTPVCRALKENGVCDE